MSKPEGLPTRNHNQRARRNLLGAGAAAAALLAAGCGIGGHSSAPKSHPSTTPQATAPAKLPSAQSPSTQPPEAENAQTYGTSEARSKQLFARIQAPGEQIVQLSRSGAIGPFDFYSAQTDSWRSQSSETKGWGWLQHNPQYGGSPDQVSVFVYMDSNGEIDTRRGIQGISTNVKGHAYVSIESNLEHGVISPELRPGELGWDVNFSRDPDSPNGVNPNDDSALAYTIEAVQKIDHTALDVISASLHALTAQ